MKNFLNSKLSICFLVFVAFLTLSTNTFAQKKSTIVPSVVPPGGGGGPVPDEPPSNLINCNLTNSNPCNLIPNNTFNTICTDTYKPFESCINFWTSSHGTPQLNQYPPQLSTTTSHASMWARAYMNSSGTIISEGEGIAVGIPHLITNRSYTISFFKKNLHR